MAVSTESPSPSGSRAGREGARLSRIRQLQRSRLIAALIDAVEHEGDPQPTVSQIISRARVSRKTFYHLFCDREDCFVAAFEETFSRARKLASEAYRAEPGWREGTRAALGCLLTLMDEHPGLTRLCVVHSLAGGERVALRREELMAQLADLVDLGRGLSAPASELERMTADGVVGGIHALIHRRLVCREDGPLSDLLGPLMSMIVLPYLGPQVACQERRTPYRPAPGASLALTRRNEDALSGISIRLTYRTVRVLIALAESPYASNRDVAAAADIHDQGQVSKLLARLDRLGLVENQGAGQAKGAANAWRLTDKGERLEYATRPRRL
jgi:AcrR family transcriptional regulator/DNA-binding MarR family transcriptional regulator